MCVLGGFGEALRVSANVLFVEGLKTDEDQGIFKG